MEIGEKIKAALAPHPSFGGGGVGAVTTVIKRSTDRLAFHYAVVAPHRQLAIDALAQADRADGLWRRTCMEAFIADSDGAYCEFNFSPSGQWAVYAFDAYRLGMRSADVAPPQIEVSFDEKAFNLFAEVSLTDLPISQTRPWRLGLSAVVQDKHGEKSYWALSHHGDAPDFHHSDCFEMELA